MSEFHFSLRRIVMAMIGVLGFLLLPFGATGIKVAEWARRNRDKFG